jgi:hypothetical protein
MAPFLSTAENRPMRHRLSTLRKTPRQDRGVPGRRARIEDKLYDEPVQRGRTT